MYFSRLGYAVHAELVLEVPVEHGLLVENLLDLAHAPFTHTSTFAKVEGEDRWREQVLLFYYYTSFYYYLTADFFLILTPSAHGVLLLSHSNPLVLPPTCLIYPCIF